MRTLLGQSQASAEQTAAWRLAVHVRHLRNANVGKSRAVQSMTPAVARARLWRERSGAQRAEADGERGAPSPVRGSAATRRDFITPLLSFFYISIYIYIYTLPLCKTFYTGREPETTLRLVSTSKPGNYNEKCRRHVLQPGDDFTGSERPTSR